MSDELVQEAKRIFVRKGNKIKRAFRCTAGRRKGKAVQNLSTCFKKKNIALSRKLKIAAKKVKFKRIRKAAIGRKKAIHFILTRLNK